MSFDVRAGGFGRSGGSGSFYVAAPEGLPRRGTYIVGESALQLGPAVRSASSFGHSYVLTKEFDQRYLCLGRCDSVSCCDCPAREHGNISRFRDL